LSEPIEEHIDLALQVGVTHYRILLMLKSRLSKKMLPAWAMLGAGLLATVFASLQVKQSIEHDAVRQLP